MDANYLLYGKKYPFLFENTPEESGILLKDSCNCHGSTSRLYTEPATAELLAKFGFGMKSRFDFILKNKSHPEFVLYLPNEQLGFRILAIQNNLIVKELSLKIILENDLITVRTTLPGGAISNIVLSTKTNTPVVFEPVVPTSRLSWDDRWDNCMRKQIPSEGPFSVFNWVVSGESLRDAGDCIGRVSGWW